MKSLVTQLAGHRSKDTGAAGILVVLDDDGCVLVETNVAAVLTADAPLGADDNSLNDFALLHSAAGSGLANGSNDDVADVAGLALGAAQDTDAREFP